MGMVWIHLIGVRNAIGKRQFYYPSTSSVRSLIPAMLKIGSALVIASGSQRSNWFLIYIPTRCACDLHSHPHSFALSTFLDIRPFSVHTASLLILLTTYALYNIYVLSTLRKNCVDRCSGHREVATLRPRCELCRAGSINLNNANFTSLSSLWPSKTSE